MTTLRVLVTPKERGALSDELPAHTAKECRS
jgi:hypothetical protein